MSRTNFGSSSLPTFYFSTSQEDVKHHQTFYQTRGGSDPEPFYSLKRPDPSSPAAKNCYAVALFDAYTPDILYGEVLIRPEWTQPSLSQDEIRKNGGVPPPPEPIMPTEFTIQLYNPDQQITVKREQGLLGSPHYDFSMPQDTFRLPSSSALDHSQDDPAAADTTTRINFSWKKESKLSKDFTCFNRGKSTDAIQKRKHKEPDIAVALFKSLKEVTIYESNLTRLDMQDAKGLEVTILLGATVIRDVFHGQMRHTFNVSESERRTSSETPAPSTTSNNANLLTKRPSNEQKHQPTGSLSPPRPGGHQRPNQPNTPPLSSHLTAAPRNHDSRPPPKSPITDPRTQWEIDAETTRLRQQSEAEALESRRRAESRRRERERQDEEESRRLRKQVEAEEKERRRRARSVERETERLKRIYGDRGGLAPGEKLRPQTHSAPLQQGPFPNRPGPPPEQVPALPPRFYQGDGGGGSSGPRIQTPPPHQHHHSRPGPYNAPAAASGLYMSGGLGGAESSSGQGKSGRKSFWNLRGHSEDHGKYVAKKSSSVF